MVSGDRGREAIRTRLEPIAASFSDDGTVLLTSRNGAVRIVSSWRPRRPYSGCRRRSWRGALGRREACGRLRRPRCPNGRDRFGRSRQVLRPPGNDRRRAVRDGRLLATGHAGKTVRVWDTETGARLLKLFGHVGGIVAVALSPRGDLVASASTDGVARVWQVDGGLPVAVFAGHTNALTNVAFSADGTQLVTASRDRTVRVWKVDTSAPLAVLRGHTDEVTSACVRRRRPARRERRPGREGTRVDARVQPELRLLADLGAPVKSVAYGDRGGVVRAATRDGVTHVLNPATGAELRTEPGRPLSCPTRGPDGTTATIRGADVVLESDGRTRTLDGHDAAVTSACFSADGTQVVTASRDRDARIWDGATGALRMVLQGHFGPVRDARFSPDGRWVVTAGPGRAGALGRAERCRDAAPRAYRPSVVRRVLSERARDRHGRCRLDGSHLSVRHLRSG